MSNGEKEVSKVAVFRPNRAYMNGPKLVEMVNNQDDSVNYQNLTHKQVLAEIELGFGDTRGGKRKAPNSPILNHCTLISASEDTTKALKKFLG